MTTNWIIEPLNADHERDGFHCGKPSLGAFLHRLASQYEKRKIGRTYVATADGEKRVVGY